MGLSHYCTSNSRVEELITFEKGLCTNHPHALQTNGPPRIADLMPMCWAGRRGDLLRGANSLVQGQARSLQGRDGHAMFLPGQILLGTKDANSMAWNGIYRKTRI